MIDRTARTRLAEAIRSLAAGQITNDQFEELVSQKSADPAIREIFANGAWCLYSDTSEYRLAGRYRLPDGAKTEVARWVLFLGTDREYEWPSTWRWRGLLLLFLNLISLGFYGSLYRKHLRALGDWDVWPFFRRTDYEAAVADPRYLAGAL